MKSIVLVIGALMIGSITVMAQKSSAIIKGGVNFANISNNDDGGFDDNRMLTSFHAGVIADLNLTEFLALQPGLLYTGKGIKFENDLQKLTYSPRYLELPVNLVFKTPTGNAKFFIGAGPYAAVGLGGKFKGEGLVDFESDIQFSGLIMV